MSLLLRLGVVAALVLGLSVTTLIWRRVLVNRTAWTPKVQRLPLTTLPVRTTAPVQLLSFTSRLCADCHEVPRVALEAAPEAPLLLLDVRDHPDLVARLGIHSTPTLLLVDEAGRIRWSHVGLPDPVELWLYVREAWDSTRTVQALQADRRRAAPDPQR